MESNRMVDRRRAAAFTLIELLVVILIISILSGLLATGVFIVLQKGKYAMARTEMRVMGTALAQYHSKYHSFPPDTGNWNEPVFDPESIYKYLCRSLETDPGRLEDPIMSVQEDKAPNGIYLDPWGNPYQFDAMHVVKFKPTGWPYMPSRTEMECIKSYKILSCGADGITDPNYPFDFEGPRVGPAADDAQSW